MRIVFIIIALFIAHDSAVAQPEFKQPEFKQQALVDGLAQPWALAILDDKRILITEKPGNLRVFASGQLSAPVKGVPDVYHAGQGGLLDVAVVSGGTSPRILLSYAAGSGDSNALTVATATLTEDPELRLTDFDVIFEVTPDKATPVHYGGRLAVLPDNTLLITSGDGFDYRESAQKSQSLLGKIIRINLDGSIPDDNPYVSQDHYHPAIYSLGHRNPQSVLYDASRNWIVSHEHGPAGGDEINIIEAGKNYGWPVITYGKDYSGASISPFQTYPGMQQPFVDWTPSIAPSDMIVYTGSMFPMLRGDFLVTTLKSGELRRVDLQGNEVVSQSNLLTGQKTRYRAIEQDKDGAIYLLTDSGKLLRLDK